MVSLYSVWHSTRIRFRRLIGSRKSAVILICQLIFCYYIFAPMTRLAIAYKTGIPPAAFVFYLSFYRMLVLHGGVTVFLFSDLLAPDSFTLWQILHMGKLNYILGQILYVFLLSFLNTAVLYLYSLILTAPVLTSFSEWGKLMYTMARSLGSMSEETGILASFGVNEMILNTMSPLEALGAGLLMLWLTSSFVGTTILFFAVFINRETGIIVCGIMISMTMFAMFIGLITVGKWLNYVSPLSWSYIGNLDLYKYGEWPTFRYAVTFLTAGISLETCGILIRFPICDLKE